MSNPVCISPLKFYDSPAKQNHRKSYAYGHISPLITKTGWIPPFQFVIPTQDYINGGNVIWAQLFNAKTDTVAYNLPQTYFNDNFSVETLEGYSGGYIPLTPDETHSSYGYSDRIYYPEVDTKKDKYFVIRVTNPYTDTITNFQISVSIYSTELKWWEIMLIVIGVIIFIILDNYTTLFFIDDLTVY